MALGRAAAPSEDRIAVWGWEDTKAFPGFLSGGLPCHFHPLLALPDLGDEGTAQGWRALSVKLLTHTLLAETCSSHPQHMANSTDIPANCCDQVLAQMLLAAFQ